MLPVPSEPSHSYQRFGPATNRIRDSSEGDSETERSSSAKRRKIATEPVICFACRQLDLQSLEARANEAFKETRQSQGPLRNRVPQKIRGPDNTEHVFYNDGFLVQRFGNRLSTATGCPLCRFFGKMRVRPELHQNHKLMAFCSGDSAFCCLARLRESDNCEKVYDSIHLAVVPDYPPIPPNAHAQGWAEEDVPTVGSIFFLSQQTSKSSQDLQPPDLPTDGPEPPRPLLIKARRLDDKVQFEILQEWYSFCKAHHIVDCRLGNGGDLVRKAFRLIDCLKDPPTVEEYKWGTPYVALSYVWGTSEKDKEEWPATVLDAVHVTKEMGLRYLWVDRLCIDQNNAREKEYLISKMEAIYEYAEFAIVAAAGLGASHGLPGVRSTPRKPQPSVQIESGRMLVSTCPDPRFEILKSEYWTRGWTYQEAVLARRRLVFTDHQAYWECRCMAAQESTAVPLELAHENHEGKRMGDFMRSGIFRGPEFSAGATRDTDSDGTLIGGDSGRQVLFGFRVAQDNPIRSRLRGLNEHVREFTARRLGFDGDSYAAFLGVAKWYSSSHGLFLLLGVPIWIGTMPGDRPGARITFAYSVTAWYHRRGDDHHVFVSEACRRRTHLPSWTWAGWEGKVTWRSPPTNEHAAIMCEMIQREIGLIWGAEVSLLQKTYPATPIRFRDVTSLSDLAGHERAPLLIVQGPLILNQFALHPPSKKEVFQWQTAVGRVAEDKIYAGRMAFDRERRRLAGRMVAIGMSVQMTMEEWVEKHSSGELVSVLMWAGRTPCAGDGKHGSARFLTLRRLPSTTAAGRWERVGVLQLTLVGFPSCELGMSRTTDELLSRLPVKNGEPVIVIE